ncbi:unnamed protein product [Cyprideis torosa]|uniref:Uncharacterized protein n=1 Tax=Cyprideis torosa TaxID=163714 RepID=A0A7R8ZL97_9CRUS|nr:unnamed protein product [Cyprideis torosa]CAG0881818.1 unnamed protein product [Cyprideis torosa]
MNGGLLVHLPPSPPPSPEEHQTGDDEVSELESVGECTMESCPSPDLPDASFASTTPPPEGRDPLSPPSPREEDVTSLSPSCDLQEVFRLAVRRESVEDACTLLEKWGEHCLDVNSFDAEGLTALHEACLQGNLKLTRLLVRHGAKVTLSSRDGWSPLHLAAWSGRLDIFLFLLPLCGGSRR